MGHEARAHCRECGAGFAVRQGGGFSFHLLRCDQCGSTRAVAFDDLGVLHLRYIKGLPTPYCLATEELDSYVQKNAVVEPLGEGEYRREVETVVGSCAWGGRYTFDASPRCPKCRSVRIEIAKPTVMYD